MSTHLITSIRAVLFATLLTCAGPAANAGSAGTPTNATARTTAHTTGEAPRADRDGVPADGALIIVGIVGAVVLFAWVCSRFGDSRQPTIMR
ncbi:hypothetical protein [Frigoriglobus tundricola]|uniref:Uncharacterized protein n=1 Tax=Frigoriglobus tundricola TaxID=2774151 RepID=A0A6M5YSX5_9BACT|nr:hypothetical protein [Frigoriglobus tundricola]QJW96391.1 hypothetical protein FTUN_3948 [Frigoriglobus tundricola]